MKDFRPEISYDEEKCLRDKVMITEKAVVRYNENPKAAKECPSNKGKNVAKSAEKSLVAVCESVPEIVLSESLNAIKLSRRF